MTKIICFLGFYWTWHKKRPSSSKCCASAVTTRLSSTSHRATKRTCWIRQTKCNFFWGFWMKNTCFVCETLQISKSELCKNGPNPFCFEALKTPSSHHNGASLFEKTNPSRRPFNTFEKKDEILSQRNFVGSGSKKISAKSASLSKLLRRAKDLPISSDGIPSFSAHVLLIRWPSDMVSETPKLPSYTHIYLYTRSYV